MNTKAFLVSDLLLGYLVSFFVALNSFAQDTSAIASVEIGFDGIYKAGHWVPLRIEIGAASGLKNCQLKIVASDGDGVQVAMISDQAATGANADFSTYVKIGRTDADLSIRLLSDGETKAARIISADEIKPALTSQATLILTLGGHLDLDPVLRVRKATETIHHVTLTSVRQFPDHWIGYSSVDLLLIPTLKNDLIGQLSEAQLQAIVQYVKRGGQVIFSAGQKATDFFGDQQQGQHPLAELLPANFDRVVQERQTAGIEDFVGGASQRLDMASDLNEPFSMPIARLTDVDGQVFVEEGIGNDRKPLVISGINGFGRIVFLAFDLDLDAISNWNDRVPLMNNLLDLIFGRVGFDAPQEPNTEMTRSGYNDLVGQLRAALDIFAGARLTPFSIVASLVVIYLLVIGPLDYFLLFKWKRRFVWTWFTFPLFVFLFCGLAYGLVEYSKSKKLSVNRCSIVDVDLKGHQAFGTSWFHLYSPKAAQFNLTVNPVMQGITEINDQMFSWQGLPGTGFGGMNAGLASSTADEYSLIVRRKGAKLDSRIERLPITGNTSRSLVGNWSVNLDPTWYADGSTLKPNAEKQLTGIISNPLPVDLRDCLLVYDRWAYSVGMLGAGQAKSLADIKPRDLKTILTQQEFVEGQYKTSPWDRNSTDMHRIGQLMMFYSAVRGRTYTKLLHRYQNYLDSSKLLEPNRAFLVGRAQQAPDQLLQDGGSIDADENSPVIFYRISLPVTPESDSP